MQFTDPQSQGPARAARRALASLLTPSLGLLIAGLSAGQDRAQGDLKVPGAIPYFNPDLKTDAPVQVLKDGVTPTDLSHLTLAERSAYNDRWNALLEQRAPGASALEAKAGATLDVNAMKSGVDARRFHQLDRASDGTLWAFGGDYKASFGVDGATYIPFLGSGAPQSYPLTFQVLEATLGRAPLALDHTALASFDGATAVYERGALQERYATRVGSLEQLFVFDRLPGNGDLVVRLRVTSELAGAATTDGLAWSNDLGGVTYSSAVAIDAAGRAVAAPTTLQDGVVELRVPAAFVASARLPLTIDPVLATYTVAATTAVELNPDIAYDNDNGRFLICWEREFSATDHDVWGEMFDPAPAAPSGRHRYRRLDPPGCNMRGAVPRWQGTDLGDFRHLSANRGWDDQVQFLISWALE
ncbi:MAG: hypothetical protein R3F49_18755 [Planctomycetota bacterium]